MSTLILIATSSVSGVIGAAAMFIPAKRQRDDAKTFMERGEETFDQAEALATEVERTRNMPWHYADEHMTGEVLAIESAEPRALSAESHEDEQAPAEDDDHAGWWQWLLATLSRLRVALLECCAEQVRLIRDLMPRRQPASDDGLREVLIASGYDLDEPAESMREAREIEVAEIVAVEGRKKVRYHGRHWLGDVQHTAEYQLIPSQRDGEVAA